MNRIIFALLVIAIITGGYLYLQWKKPVTSANAEIDATLRRLSMASKSDPNLIREKEARYKQELKELIARGEFELMEVKELDSGDKFYIYKFLLSNGEEFAYGTRHPLKKKTE